MSTFHIIIQQERRTQPERMAQAISSTVQQGDEYIAGPKQLHHMGTLPEMLDDPQFVMVAEWDLQTPYVICHRGDYSKRNLHFGGWPEMTKEQFDAIPADLPL
jgi:hypothetical protein